MEKESLEFISVLIAVAAFLLSIGTALVSYNSYQKLKRRIANDTYSKLYTDNNQFRKLFIDNPSFRKYFFKGEPVREGDGDFDKASAIAEVIINYLEHLVIHAKSSDLPYMVEWERLVTQFRENSPIMVHMVNESKTIKVTSELKELFNA